jgi:hypothetical protein
MNRFAVLVMLLFAAYSMALSAQESPRNQKSRRIFTAADGTFRFSYSRALVPCHINPNHTNLGNLMRATAICPFVMSRAIRAKRWRALLIPRTK